MYIDMDCPCQGKNLDKLLQPLILCILLQGGDMHGFAILKEIGKIPRFADKVPDLDDAGKPKRVFSITPEGKGCLANWAQALSDYENYIHQLIEMIHQSI